MAITKIQPNAIPSGTDFNIQLTDGSVVTADIADLNVTTAKIADANVTHAKLHTDMDLSGKTVTLPSLSGTLIVDGGYTNNDDNAAVFKGTGTEHIKLLLDTSSTGGHRASVALESNGKQVSIDTVGQGNLAFSTTSAANAMYITEAGNVGIGTTSPSTKLHIATTAVQEFLTVENTGGTGANILIKNTEGSYWLGTNDGQFYVYDKTDTATRLTIDTSGNVGIGTSSPSGKLHAYTAADDQLLYGSNPRLWLTTPTGYNGLRVYGDTTPMEFKINSGTYNGAQFSMGGNGDLSLIGPTTTSSNTWVGSPHIFLNAMKWNGSANVTSFQGSIRSHLRSAGANDGYLGLGANANANHLVIDAASGNVGIGTTDPQYQLQVGDAYHPFAYTTVGSNSHAITDGKHEFKAYSFALGGGGSALISDNTVSSDSQWEVIFRGHWANNYEGGGLYQTATTTYVNSGRPYVWNGSTTCQIYIDGTSNRLRIGNNNGSYAIHFTGTIEVIISKQGNLPGISALMPALELKGNTNLGGNGTNYGGLVLRTPNYDEYHYSWGGNNQTHTTWLTCGSYAHMEVIYTSHQTNGGSDIHEYIRGKWANNHTTHTWVVHEDVGNTDTVNLSISVSDNTAGGAGTNSGRLTITEVVGGGSYANTKLIVRVWYGGFTFNHSP